MVKHVCYQLPCDWPSFLCIHVGPTIQGLAHGRPSVRADEMFISVTQYFMYTKNKICIIFLLL